MNPEAGLAFSALVALSVLALRSIWWLRPGESMLWRVMWTLISLFPLFGPIMFFGLATLPDQQPRDMRARGGFYSGASMGSGGVGAEGIPGLYGLLEHALEETDSAGVAETYMKRAQEGDARSQAILAALYDAGRGIEKDPDKAIYWYRKAAEQGNPNAQTRLAAMVGMGTGDLPPDPAEAARWLKQAAESGFAPAQCEYGAALFCGFGMPRNDEEAYFWLARAQFMGCDHRPVVRLDIERSLTAQQQQEIRQRAMAWKPAGSGDAGT